MKYKTFANYRIFVSILLFISFISPWERLYSDIFPWVPPIIANGFHKLFSNLWKYTQPDLIKGSLSDIWIIGIDMIITAGLIIILSYSVSNIYLMLRRREYMTNRKKSLRNIVLLFLSTFSVLLSISFPMNSCVDWGSWAMVMSLGFAISVEMVITLNLDRDA